MRKEVQELVNMGPLPDCETVAEEQLKMYESLLSRVTPPVSNDEARSLVRLFGPDDCYGLAWTLLHLIESAPGWPLHECLKDIGLDRGVGHSTSSGPRWKNPTH
jgi:hypothetical protein